MLGSCYLEDISSQATFNIDSDPSSKGSGVITLAFPHGTYEVQILDSQNVIQKVDITIVKSVQSNADILGPWRLQSVIAKTSVHALSPVQDSTLPLRIVSASIPPAQRSKMRIKIEGTVREVTRVHCFVSTFVGSEMDAPQVFGERRGGVVVASVPCKRDFVPPEVLYGNAEELAEELRYVLERNGGGVHPIGNSLEKPGVILNRRVGIVGFKCFCGCFPFMH